MTASGSPSAAIPGRDAAVPPPAARLWPWVLLAAAALALRKPWALHTPQLWAEDGSVFLVQDGQLGVSAWWTPYNGYLHLLPRLIAWIARLTVDVAWWPAVYNGLAFACSAAVFARLASPRVHLPAKPGLMLAFALVAGTGETLLNVTNLQWFTAFFLLLQLFTAPPATAAQRAGDLLILVVVGLNGPFALVFLPLFAWCAWTDRAPAAPLLRGLLSGPGFLPFLAVAACALVQARFLVGHGLSLDGTAEAQPFRPLMFFSIVGSRLVTWPLLGPAAVRAWPVVVHAALGLLVIGALLASAARRDPLRRTRLTVAAAFLLVTVACVVRVRADTWSDDNLVNGDRYFFIPRILLAWLVLLEWHHTRPGARWSARLACVAAVVTHAPHHVLPAPPDYRWALHCDPIRRGQPANIHTLPEGWWIEYPGR